uniref:Reverse transcriptase domain-containing protein n=1 Tax=Labrus bergylta TaxID=56723 RepID=A0A3Q3GB82_9LABR
ICLFLCYGRNQQRVNENTTGWFPQQFGVKQGDVLSPILFSIYINDLIVGILLYADDVVLLAEREDDLQIMLNIVAEWCLKWRLVANEDKIQVVHFRQKSLVRCPVSFNLGTTVLSYEIKSVFHMSFIFLNNLTCDIQEIKNNTFLMYKEKWSVDI